MNNERIVEKGIESFNETKRAYFKLLESVVIRKKEKKKILKRINKIDKTIYKWVTEGKDKTACTEEESTEAESTEAESAEDVSVEAESTEDVSVEVESNETQEDKEAV